jgi:diguanylate cyclase (GGDEF)-like protein
VKIIEASEKVEFSQRRILIVDDEEAFRESLRSLVESLSYICTEADSGPKALELLKRTHFPIVIADIVMLKMDGLELLHRIKKGYSDVDVLIITGYNGKYSPSKIIQAGASDFLEKPFTLDQLKARLSRIENERVLRRKLYVSAITDELTGLYNRRHFYRKLRRETQRAKRQRHPLSLIMLDVDGFKGFNDQHGHLKGDTLLKRLASVLRVSVRQNVDSAFRYGGDEFVVTLPDAKADTAHSIASRIKTNFKATAPVGVGLSMGIAEFHKDFDVETFVHLADERMYEDKRKPGELRQIQPEVDLVENRQHIRCLTCGSLVDSASPVCANCMADPRRKTSSETDENIARESLKESTYPYTDRRKTPRIQMRKTFLYDGLQATIHTISQGGAQLKTKASLSVGESIKLAFPLENGMTRFVGSVVYRRVLSGGSLLVGIQFTQIPHHDRLLLNRFINPRLTTKGQTRIAS